MYHLFDRVYLDVDVFDVNKSNFYIASESMAAAYGDGSQIGPSLLGIYTNDQAFVDTDFFELLKELNGTDKKIVIYVSRESYLALVAKWVKAVFPTIDTDRVRTLVYFEYLRLYFDGLSVPSSPLVTGEINKAADTGCTLVFKEFVASLLTRTSMEYKILHRLKGKTVVTLADDVRLFAERSSQHFITDTQRNLRSMFYNGEMQRRYGYSAKIQVGRLNLLPMITQFKVLNDPSLADRLKMLTATEITDLVKDIGFYLNGLTDIGDEQRAAELSKLTLISKIEPLSDDRVIDQFIQVLRDSNEHTDYLDWDDSDMLNIPLIQYILTLTDTELQGF